MSKITMRRYVCTQICPGYSYSFSFYNVRIKCSNVLIAITDASWYVFMCAVYETLLWLRAFYCDKLKIGFVGHCNSIAIQVVNNVSVTVSFVYSEKFVDWFRFSPFLFFSSTFTSPSSSLWFMVAVHVAHCCVLFNAIRSNVLNPFLSVEKFLWYAWHRVN